MSNSDPITDIPPESDPYPKTRKILFDKYELGKLLGRGASAKVYHARDLSTSQSVAIKIIPKSKISKSHASIVREISILRLLRHPHIVRPIELLASRSKIYLVLELAGSGELFSHLDSSGRLPEHLSRKIFHQLISAVGYCHSRGVFHRDLKPQNLLLDDNGDLKVSDFGLSALSADNTEDVLLHTLCGTPAYVAPEILAKNGYEGAKVDVWSCGVILFVLNAGYLPFNDLNLMSMYRKIYRGEYRVPKWTSPELERLTCRILDTNPHTRMNVDEIVNDPWFTKGLDPERWTVEMRSNFDEEKMDEEERELNAFDLISLSSGADLSGLFEPASDRERFVSGETAVGILGRVEELGTEEGFWVKREGQSGKRGVMVRRQNGDLVVRVGVYRLTSGPVIVEADKGADKWAQEFWTEKVRPAIRGVGRRIPVESSLNHRL